MKTASDKSGIDLKGKKAKMRQFLTEECSRQRLVCHVCDRESSKSLHCVEQLIVYMFMCICIVPLREAEMLSPPNKNSLPFFHNLAITPGKTESNIVVQSAHSPRVGCLTFLNFQGLAIFFQGSLRITLVI